MSNYKPLYTIVILFSTLIISCSSDSPLDPEEENIPTGNFSLITPEHESTIASNNLTFSWEQADDPKNLEITYVLHLDKNNPPSAVIASDIEDTEYTLEQQLKSGTTYYWQIVTINDSDEKTRSKDIYSFKFIEGSGIIANDDLGMPLRYLHSLELFDDKLWMFAGQAGGHSERDVWYSEDGIEWKIATDRHEFPPRFSHTSLVFNNKIWIIGGTVVGRFFNDVWNTDDGSNWHEVTSDAPFGLRFDHSSVVFDNRMWVIGGHVIDQEEPSEETVNDVWSSSDGENWTQITDKTGFQPRIGHESVVFDDKIWVIGGSGSQKYLKDVWYSENGMDWTLATDDLGISDISIYESIVYEGKIWLIGGTPDGGGVSGEIWYSSDGSNWEQALPFFGRVGHAVTVFQNKIWGVGGLSHDSDPSDVNDSWYLNVP